MLKLLPPVIRTGLLACVGFCLATFPGKAFQISPGAASEEVFEVRAGFNGIDFTRASAADPHLAVGSSSLVLVANWSIVVRNKDGSLLAARTLDDFFSPTQVDDQRTKLGGFDSRAYFDRTTQRFYVVSTAVRAQSNGVCRVAECRGTILLAVSRGPSPSLAAADWLFHAIDGMYGLDTATPSYVGEPVLGFTRESVVIAVALTDVSTHVGRGSLLRVISKKSILSSSSASPIQWSDIRPNAGFVMPMGESHLGAAGMPLASVRYPIDTSCSVTVWGLENLLTTPRLSFQTIAGSQSCSEPSNPEQPGNARPFANANSSLFLGSVFFAGESAWIAHTVAAAGSSSTIRWAQVDLSPWPSTVRLAQDSIFSVDSRDLYYPAIGSDEKSNVVIVFAESGKTESPSLYFAGRLASDPPSTLRSRVLLKAGNSSLDPPSSVNRYGDYFGIALDPVDGTFWVAGQYAKTSTEWGMWVSNIALR